MLTLTPTVVVVAVSMLLLLAVVAEAASETLDWVRFSSFEYHGTDRVADAAPPKADEYLNPILAGFYPDPSICRVPNGPGGDDYYLVNSTFSWFPGVPIFHSRDLVNWKQIGHVLDRPSQLPLEGRGVSQGIFAPAICYHDGLFYMITTLVGQGGGNFYVTAKNPAGPWSEPTKLPEVEGIDPSFFFDDDGKAYVVNNGPPEGKQLYGQSHRAIWMQEFDAKRGVTFGPRKVIVNGGVNLEEKPVWIEGPHLFRHEGWYYLICAEGGTGKHHSEVVFRSKEVWGPYIPGAGERNPILTQRHLDADRPNPVTCTGHADFVKMPNGDWWAVFLGMRPYEGGENYEMTNIGRETFMLPVEWRDGWPVILEGEQVVPRVGKRPELPTFEKRGLLTGSFTWRDDFDGDVLGHAWCFLRTPPPPESAWWSLDAKPGMLSIEPRAVGLDSRTNPSLIARRQQHAQFEAATVLEIDGATKDCDAGLAVFQNERHHFFAGVRVRGGAAREVLVEQAAGEGPIGVIGEMKLPAGAKRVELRVIAAGRPYSFYWRTDGGEWKPVKVDVDGSILSTQAAGGFVGCYVGMYARSVK